MGEFPLLMSSEQNGLGLIFAPPCLPKGRRPFFPEVGEPRETKDGALGRKF